MASQCVLWITEGPMRGTVYPLRADDLRIGRGIDCDIILSDPAASRLHAHLRSEKGQWWIEDSNSRNGIRVNGIPVRRRRLEPQDRVQIGATTLQIAQGTPDSPGIFPSTIPNAGSRGLDASPSEDEVSAGFVGKSRVMRDMFRTLERIFTSEIPVLIAGESGTGKELVARAIHMNGKQRNGPWVAVHCAALSPGTLESELFGHEKGSFTGAAARRIGRFEWADGGTLFMDEVGEIPLGVQATLLRVLETGEFQRVGGNETVRSHFRLVTATHRDLEREVRNGKFREDLLYRLQVIRLDLPPLREREEDPVLLAQHFLDRFSRDGRTVAKRISPAAAQVLRAYPWPGNVRELRNRMERLCLFHQGGEVTPEDLADLAAYRSSATGGSLADRRGKLERSEIQEALRKTAWNKQRAAALLGIDRKTLRMRIVRWGLKPE